jgi:hypothetical protein
MQQSGLHSRSHIDVYYILQRMSELKAARNVIHMAVVGNLTYGETTPGCFMLKPEFRAARIPATFAEAFDFHGHVFSYDQGRSADKHYRA